MNKNIQGIIKKNDIYKIEITGMTTEGAGVGRHNNFAIFVPLSAIGDVLSVRIVKVLKNFAFGKIEEIITPSPYRITPDCDVFSQCGGCAYRHISYENELEIKTDRIKSSFERIGGLSDINIKPIVGANTRNHYRNKALIPIGKNKDGELILGFYALNSHRIVNCKRCMLQPEDFNIAMDVFREWHKRFDVSVYDEFKHSGVLRNLYLRCTSRGDLLFGVIINGNKLEFQDELLSMLREALPKLSGFIININKEKTNVVLGKKNHVIFGDENLIDTLCGLDFNISPLSFYQVNHAQTEKLYAIARKYAHLTGNEVLLDLYCGAGTIGLTMAKNAQKLIGVEIISEAIDNATQNARQNKIDNAEFICADATSAAETLNSRGEKPDVIIVDPPRKGLTHDLIKTIASMAPERIVYVSCDPATLARDLKLFSDSGYFALEATPVDMFPATPHVETVALLSNKRR